MKRIILVLLALTSSNLSFARTIHVAVIDTGIDFTHKDLKGLRCKDIPSVDFTNSRFKITNEHGTHVAGIIKQKANNKNFCITSIKFYDETASGKENQERFYKSLEYAFKNKFDIINTSSGGTSFSEKELLLIQSNLDITLVTVAGNDGKNETWYPGGYGLPNVRTVGALKMDGTRLPSSNYSKMVTHWEIGENVYSTLPNNGYGYLSGTSMACAVATGKLINVISKKSN